MNLIQKYQLTRFFKFSLPGLSSVLNYAILTTNLYLRKFSKFLFFTLDQPFFIL